MDSYECHTGSNLACLQVRDEHRTDYDPGRGGWGAQAQRLEIERRREVEERYADAQEGPGAVAEGGGDWKEVATGEKNLKRGRSPEDADDDERVCYMLFALQRILMFRYVKVQRARLDGADSENA